MSLEMTPEQEGRILVALQHLCCLPSSADCTCNYALAAKKVFALVRDMVLEEVAGQMRDIANDCGMSMLVGEDLATAIRTMKGKP